MKIWSRTIKFSIAMIGMMMLGTIAVAYNCGPDLSITMSHSPDTLFPGDIFTWSVTGIFEDDFMSEGELSSQLNTVAQSIDVFDVFVTITLPIGVTLLNVTAPLAICGQQNLLVTCNFGEIFNYYPGDTFDIDLTVQVDSTVLGDTLIAFAFIDVLGSGSPGSDFPEDDKLNNSTSDTASISRVINDSDISVSIEDSQDPILIGQPLTWTVTINNDGPGDAQSVTVSVILPDRTTLISIFSLLAAQTSDPQQFPLTAVPQLVEKTSSAPSGSTQTQSVGGAIPCEVDGGGGIAAPLPSSGNVFDRSGSRTINCQVPILPAGASALIEITVEPEVAGVLLSSVSVQSTSNDPSSFNNSSEQQTVVSAPALSVSPTCVAQGGALTLVGLFDTVADDAVQVDDMIATIQAVSSTGLVVGVPDLPTGTATVTVAGIDGAVEIRIDNSCEPRILGPIDVDAGFVIGDLLIFLEPQANDEDLVRIQSQFGLINLVEYPVLGFIRAEIANATAQSTRQILDLLNADPAIRFAFLNFLLNTLQNDPEVGQQSWLFDIGLPEGWDNFFPNRGANTIIAIIDTGTDLDLSQNGSGELNLDDQAPEGLNFAPVPEDQKTPLGQDDLGHGTAVSTIASATEGNSFNGVGVAPNATVIAMKVFAVVNGEVRASNEGVAQALENAFSLGVDVVNMSLGCQGCSSADEDQLRLFYNEIINNLLKRTPADQAPIIVAAAGNDGENLVDSPAASPAVIAVGSVKRNLTERSRFSNFGPELDFMALGENPFTTLAGGEFGTAGLGTSFAAPQVAGLVALILSENPEFNFDQVMNEIRRCFVVDIGDPGFDEETGWGRISIPLPDDAADGCLP